MKHKALSVGPSPWRVVRYRLATEQQRQEGEQKRLKELELVNAERRRLSKEAKREAV